MGSAKDKINRGFVAEGDEKDYTVWTNEELTNLLHSNVAIERTIGARILTCRNHEFVENLLIALETEQKLYTKIELCRSLAILGEHSVKGLIQRLGKIGNNQHRTPTDEPFKKNSYPLPRDIAARTLIRIGSKALPALCGVLTEDDSSKISEAIDAIGFICYSGGQDKYLEPLIDCYNKLSSNNLIRWKIIRAMSAFPASMTFLKKQFQIENVTAIKQEIERSIRMIERK